MESNELLELYLRKVVEYCQVYDAFSIPAAMMAGGSEIKLQDIYTHLSVVDRDLYYEQSKSSVWDENFSKNGGIGGTSFPLIGNITRQSQVIEDSVDIESLIAKIDAKIAELEAKEADAQVAEQENFISDENSAKDAQNVDFSEKEELNWEWFLSAPGGGKTTLLKMYSLALAYKYYIELFGCKDGMFDNSESIEAICEQLRISEGACPFFISARELKEEDYPDIESASGFKKVIIDTISFMIDDDVENLDVESLFNSIQKKVYIVDSVEEFSNNSFRNKFLMGLDSFSVGSRCYLSSRYREYMENVKDTKIDRDGIELSAKEYVIEGLQKDTVRVFAEKWYAALNKVSGHKKLDVEKDFLVPLYKNSNVKNLISNPLELTSLLMISSYDSYLPSDYAKIYGRSIELWLTWNNYARYNYEDVMRQLSQIAYKMATSEKEKIVVSQETLTCYILEARRDLKRYYQQEWSDDEESVKEFIQFLCRSHLVSKSTEGFDFVHRQYQAYLVAYCISTNNFSRETRKKSKFEYIEEHIREKDDFWNQIYKIIAIIDIELRDDIITTLFELSENDSIGDDNYYVSRLIELAIIPGVNFDENERKKLIELIVQDEKKWKLFNSKKVDLNELLYLNDQYSNEMFLQIAITKSEELPEKNRDIFRDAIATTVFYCIWQCAVGERYIRMALKTFFANFINTNIIEMIFNSKKLSEQQIMVKDVVCSVGREAIESGGYSDCYMLIAAILGYEENPYKQIDILIEKNGLETDVIAINILVIATWLLRCKRASRYGYGIEIGQLNRYADFILEGIINHKTYEIRRDYLAVFVDAFAIGATKDYHSTWFRKDVFDFVLQNALSEYLNDGKLYDEQDDSFTRSIEHIALYPCFFEEECKHVVAESGIEINPLVDRIRKIYNETEDIINKIYSAKLLILLLEMGYDERNKLIREIEKQASDYKVKQRLRSDDLEGVYEQGISQMKLYKPEGQQILKELDLSNFNISLSMEDDEDFSIDDLLEDFSVSNISGEEEYVDYYAEGKYEEAKQRYLRSFQLLSSRNNLAYMLRRGEITSVTFEGVTYSVDTLLQPGVEEKEPYSLVNYALYISYDCGQYDYVKGLQFLMKYKETGHLLEAASWWFGLKQKGELEGYIVCMWLAELDLNIFETKEELEKQVSMIFPGSIK